MALLICSAKQDSATSLCLDETHPAKKVDRSALIVAGSECWQPNSDSQEAVSFHLFGVCIIHAGKVGRCTRFRVRRETRNQDDNEDARAAHEIKSPDRFSVATSHPFLPERVCEGSAQSPLVQCP